MRRIYLDYNASTPIDPAVAAAMRPHLEGAFGNPSSPHWAGPPARAAIDHARGQVAALLGAKPGEIVFTSGGSEADNLAIKGLFFGRRHAGAHLVTSAVEHPAVAEPCRFLEALGARVTRLPVDGGGRIDPGDLERAITPDTILVSIMHANNETGTIQPIAACTRITRAHGIPFHTDAAQSIGKVPVDVDALGVDLLTVAGHKLYAPKGVGALYVREGLRLAPLVHGGGHEGGRRAGTESALLCSGLGAACGLAADLRPMAAIGALRDLLWSRLHAGLGERIVRMGDPHHCLPNTLNLCVAGRIGADLLAQMPELAASTGSACHAGRVELSPTLAAMGIDPALGAGAIRFSLGRWTTADEVETVAERLVALAA